MLDKVGWTAFSMTPLWHAQRSHWHRRDMHSRAIETIVICTAVSLTPLCNQLCRFFPQTRSHFQKGFNPRIRSLGGVVWWKSRGRKSRARVPLTALKRSYYSQHCGTVSVTDLDPIAFRSVWSDLDLQCCYPKHSAIYVYSAFRSRISGLD
jgi:hypothetical protein